MIINFEGKKPKIGKNVYIAPTAVIIGDVEIGDDSSVWPNAVIRGDMNRIKIGKRTNIQDGVVIHVSYDEATFISDNVTIGHCAHVHSARIGKEVLIGSNSTILDGVVIETQSLVGAGSLVSPKTLVLSGSMVVGVPAQMKRLLTEIEKERILENAQEYVNLKEIYLKEDVHD